jgi:EAL domain-containing protein (putative c-di-GMP-specific phosphodiesterase class I)
VLIPTLRRMATYKRVLFIIGGAALVASLVIAAVFAATNAADVSLHDDQVAARTVQGLADELVGDVRSQGQAIDQYLMSSDPVALAHYRDAVTAEDATAARIAIGIDVMAASSGSEITDALTDLDSVNDAWRDGTADPAVAAVQSGSAVGIKRAINAQIGDESSQVATARLVAEVDRLQGDLVQRSDDLDQLRIDSAVSGVVMELLASAVSLLFVRRFGRAVERDVRRRDRLSAERIEIVASLRTLRSQDSPEATAAVIVEALGRLPGVDVAAIFECTDAGLVALAIRGSRGFPIGDGDLLAGDNAAYLRRRSLEGPWAERWELPDEPTAQDQPLSLLGITSRSFAPIRAEGHLVGLVGFLTTDEEHGRRFIEDLAAVGQFAAVAETILAPALLARATRLAKREGMEALILSGGFRSVFQPIVELSTGNIVGYEALTRFADGVRPDLTFAAALDCGMGIELETVTLRAALAQIDDLPKSAWVSLNTSPALLAERTTLAGLLAGVTRSVVLEVTEHEAVDDYQPLRAAVAALGVRVSVDDAGAGAANFSHLVELRPDFVKIDIGLVRGVDKDPSRRAVVVGLIHFAAEAGCLVIAEGIETTAERATIAELGVTLGQGFLLARPAPASAWLDPSPGPVPGRLDATLSAA